MNIRTGAILWELGGKHSSFALKTAPGQKLDSAGEIFAFQHDPEAIGGDQYTVFDDESDGLTSLFPVSRAVTIKLDPATRTATLIRSVNQPEGLEAAATGSAQTTKNGDLFVSWGGLSYFSAIGDVFYVSAAPRGEALADTWLRQTQREEEGFLMTEDVRFICGNDRIARLAQRPDIAGDVAQIRRDGGS